MKILCTYNVEGNIWSYSYLLGSITFSINLLFLFLNFITSDAYSFAANSYSLVLRHTTEEVFDACVEAIEPARAALTSCLRDAVMTELSEALNQHAWFTGFDIIDEPPVKYSLEQWIKLVKEAQATVFIAGYPSEP